MRIFVANFMLHLLSDDINAFINRRHSIIAAQTTQQFDDLHRAVIQAFDEMELAHIRRRIA